MTWSNSPYIISRLEEWEKAERKSMEYSVIDYRSGKTIKAFETYDQAHEFCLKQKQIDAKTPNTR